MLLVNNGPTILSLPNEINEEDDDQVVAFVVADTEIQVNLYPTDNDAPTVPASNIQVLVTQTEYNPSTTSTAFNSSSAISTTSNHSPVRQLSQTVPFDANLSLSEAIERFHLDFMSFYERLRTLGSSIPHTTTIISYPVTPTVGLSNSTKPQISDRVTKTTEDINHKIIVNSHNSAKHYLERVAQRARNVIWSAACEWRSLRHSVAYTLIGSERVSNLV